MSFSEFSKKYQMRMPHCVKLNRVCAFITVFVFAASLSPCALLANNWGGPVLQAGWFTATQGKSQHVGIDGLIGDDFTVSKPSDQNFLVGVGYYFNALDRSWLDILYGLNAFYLAPLKVKGSVIQESMFSNLSYQYSRTNYPIYAATKMLIHCLSRCDITIDLGMGVNIVSTGNFREKSFDGEVVIPDESIFDGKTSAVFSATAGLGWRVHVLKHLFLEIDYRFFI